MKRFVLFILVFLVLFSGCALVGSSTTPPLTTYTVTELKYRLIAEFPDIFWVDPDFYPIAREGQELQNTLEQFPQIVANQEEFNAILEYLSLDHKASYTDEEKLLIYRQHKKLARRSSWKPLMTIMILASGRAWARGGSTKER